MKNANLIIALVVTLLSACSLASAAHCGLRSADCARRATADPACRLPCAVSSICISIELHYQLYVVVGTLVEPRTEFTAWQGHCSVQRHQSVAIQRLFPPVRDELRDAKLSAMAAPGLAERVRAGGERSAGTGVSCSEGLID